MQITRLERTVCCVPFLPGILPPPEYDEPNPSYPEPLSARRQDVLRIHTDQGLTGLGMSGPYYGDREEQPPDLIGKDPNTFEPRASARRWLEHCPPRPDRQNDRLAAVPHFRRQATRQGTG